MVAHIGMMLGGFGLFLYVARIVCMASNEGFTSKAAIVVNPDS